MKKSYLFWWIAGGLILILAILFWTGRNGSSTLSKSNREVALTCTSDMATQFHIHPHLEIIANGQRQEITANIGIDLSCMNALHTHDNSGTIHVESPEKRDFALSDFFAVWKKIFTRDQILDYKVDQTHVIRVTVNGNEVKDYENTVIRDKDQIMIYYEENK